MIAALTAISMRNKSTLVAKRLSHSDAAVDTEAALLIRNVGHIGR